MEPTRALRALAWGNVVLHGVGLAFAWFALRPGSALAPLPERMAYLAGAPPGWTWGWGVWMLCALLLLAFMAVLRGRLPESSALARIALLTTAAGMAVDLLCDVVQIQVLPLIAAAGPSETTLFLAAERLAFTGGATAANGLYTTGVLLVTLALRDRVSPLARLAGWITVAAGYAMALSGLLPSPVLLAAATGPTIGFYSLWTLLVARDLGRGA